MFGDAAGDCDAADGGVVDVDDGMVDVAVVDAICFG